MKHARLLLPAALISSIFVAAALGLAPPKKPNPPKTPPAPTGAPTGSPAKSDGADELYQKGKKAVDAGDYKTALDAFTAADKIRPNDPDILTMLGYSLRKTGSLEEARKTYLRSIELKSFNPEAREYLGECYLDLATEQLAALRKDGANAKKEYGMLKSAFDASANKAKTIP